MYDNNSALQESLWKSCILFVDGIKSCLVWGIDAIYFKDTEFKLYAVCIFITVPVNIVLLIRDLIFLLFKAEIDV